MKFNTKRNITKLALPITRECNRSCPNCPAKGAHGSHVSVEELVQVGRLIGPIEQIEVTGGEPSLHPDFAYISQNLHNWFQCKDIMLLTNGHIARHPALMAHMLNYDRVYCTHYTDKFAALYGVPNNTEMHNRVRDFLSSRPKVNFWSQTMDWHVPLGQPPYTGRCMFNYNGDLGPMVSYYNGRIYGCCTAWQIGAPHQTIPLAANWRELLPELELPCEDCFLSGMIQVPRYPTLLEVNNVVSKNS